MGFLEVRILHPSLSVCLCLWLSLSLSLSVSLCATNVPLQKKKKKKNDYCSCSPHHVWVGETILIIEITWWSCLVLSLFVIRYLNWYQQPGSGNLIGWKLESGKVKLSKYLRWTQDAFSHFITPNFISINVLKFWTLYSILFGLHFDFYTVAS